MIYREQKHPANSFPVCNGCGLEPTHVNAAGRLSREPVKIGAVSQRHMIECARCGRRTALHESLGQAIKEWGAQYAVASMPVRLVARKVAAA